jgi:hypothetical protein
MIALDVKKAMNMGLTQALMLNSSLSMAHHPTLGIVTADSILNKDKPDTSSIADNPPVSGAAGASDPNIAAVVRGIRDRLLPLASKDRSNRSSGQLDEVKLDSEDTGGSMVTGLAGRLARRSTK